MDYEISNKFSEALKFAEPPCKPIPTPAFIEYLRKAAQALHQENPEKKKLNGWNMYIECLKAYLELKAIEEVVPDENFFDQLIQDFKHAEIPRKETKAPQSYQPDGGRRIIQTVRFLMNAYFVPQGIIKRRLIKLEAERNSRAASLPKLCEQPFLSWQFIESLRKANQEIVRNPKVFKVHKTRINSFQEYLERNNIQSLVPDELFLLKCVHYFQAQKLQVRFKGSRSDLYYSDFVKIRAIRDIRMLINRYFLPQEIITRPILLKIVYERYERLFKLTKNTQQAIIWFENNGRRIKSVPTYDPSGGPMNMVKYVYHVTNQKLLPNTAYGKINHVINFLSLVGKHGIEQVNDTDLERFTEIYRKKNNAQLEDYLAHIATFFINAQSQGFIKDHSFKEVSLKMKGTSVRVDFVGEEGIKNLLDLKLLNWNDPLEVRDALSCALAYDAGLRVGEIYGLDATDINTDEDNDIYIALREGVQKGHKPKIHIYFIFDETKAILKHYLEVSRLAMKPQDQALLISTHDKKRLDKENVARRMKEFMAKRGIQTFSKKKATPHHLRHSFATLNIAPLGANMSLHEIVERLRHTKYETARKHYIHNNPYLQKQKHRAQKERINKKSNRDTLKEMPFSDLEGFLVQDLGVDADTVMVIRRKYRALRTNGELRKGQENHIMTVHKERPDAPKEDFVPLSAKELEGRIKPLRLVARAFSAYCRENGLQRRQGRYVLYSQRFLDELCEAWVPREEVMRFFDLERSQFYEMAKKRNWPSMRIGGAVLFRMKKLIENSRNRMLV